MVRILTLKSGEIKNPGGINKSVAMLNRELAKRGHTCTIIIADNSSLPREEVLDGFRIIRIGSRSIRVAYGLSSSVCMYLWRHLEESKPDVIHLHGYHGLFAPQVMILIKKILRMPIPIVFTSHYDPLTHATIAGKIFGRVIDMTIGPSIIGLPDFIVSDSKYEARNLSLRLGVERNTMTIPLGVDQISPRSQRTRGSTLRLLYTGYLLEYKGVQFIIDALYELVHVRGFRDFCLTVVGDGDYKRHLIRRSKDLRVDNFIEWKPFLTHSQHIEVMKKADILLHLSKSEAYGLIVAEALAMGIPAIVSRGTALEEFTEEPGCFGVEMPPNPSEIADLILRVSGSRVAVGPFSGKIRTWSEVAADYERVFHGLLDRELLRKIPHSRM
jgi:glycosyltransferase involved in cell wall biosynthesis